MWQRSKYQLVKYNWAWERYKIISKNLFFDKPDRSFSYTFSSFSPSLYIENNFIKYEIDLAKAWEEIDF